MYTPQLSVLFTIDTIAIRILIADLIEGPGAYRAGNPYAWAPLDVKKNFTDIYCEKICKKLKTSENVHLKCTFFRFLNTPLGGGRQHRRLPLAANTLAPPLAVCMYMCGGTGRRSMSLNVRRMQTWEVSSRARWKESIISNTMSQLSLIHVDDFTTSYLSSTNYTRTSYLTSRLASVAVSNVSSLL